jgi:predicted nucleotidyltransferase
MFGEVSALLALSHVMFFNTLKTNTKWYPYEEDGCFYRLEQGILMQCPMLLDEKRDDNPYEVDWYYGVSEKETPRLKEIVKEFEENE